MDDLLRHQTQIIDRDALIEQHRSYVRALATEIVSKLPPQIDLDELIASGNLGLVEAAMRYDPRRGVSFTTFAYYRIRGAIYDGLRTMGYLSRREYARTRFAANAEAVLQSVADDEQSAAGQAGAASRNVDDEIAEAEAVIDALIPIYLLSLDGNESFNIADTRSLSASQELEDADLLQFTRAMLDELPPDDRELIEDLYFKNLTSADLMAKLGVSKSWLSRLHARAIKRLREIMTRRGLLTEVG